MLFFVWMLFLSVQKRKTACTHTWFGAVRDASLHLTVQRAVAPLERAPVNLLHPCGAVCTLEQHTGREERERERERCCYATSCRRTREYSSPGDKLLEKVRGSSSIHLAAPLLP